MGTHSHYYIGETRRLLAGSFFLDRSGGLGGGGMRAVLGFRD